MCPESEQSGDGKLRVRIRTGTDDPVKLGRALAETARKVGAADELLKALQSKPLNNSEQIVPERAMRDLLAIEKRGYGAQQGLLFRNISLWLTAHLGTLAKASGGLPPHLRPEDIEELHLIVRGHFDTALLDVILDLYQKYGLTPSDWGFMMTSVQEAFLLGHLPFAEIEDTPLRDLRKEMAKRPRTRVDELVVEAAKRNTRSHLRRIGSIVADDIRGYVSAHEARQVADVVEAYHEGRLSRSRYSAQGLYTLTDEERQELSTPNWATSERQLRSELYSYFKSDTKNRGRDWWRVAVSETRAATNTARLLDARERGYEQIYYLLQPDACPLCKATYLEPDGTPRIFNVAKLARFAIETNGMNTDPKNAGRANSLLHPHCHCLPVPYIEGISFKFSVASGDK